MQVWSVANQKGGVGKTTTVVSLAGLLNKQGYRVLIVDTDPHASLTTYFGYNSDEVSRSLFDIFQLESITHASVSPCILATAIEGIDIIPAHMSLATLDRVLGQKVGMGLILQKTLKSLKTTYDYVLIDCPPVLGVMMVNSLAACNRVLIPVQTEFLAMKGLERMIRTLSLMTSSRGKGFLFTIIPTMYDRRTRASLKTLSTLKNNYGDQVWNSAIPIDTKFRDASIDSLPLSHYAGTSRGNSAYKKLLKYLKGLSNGK